MKKSVLLSALFIILALGLSISCGSQNSQGSPPLLRDYPDLFSTGTIIIHADNASSAELKAAETLQGKLAEIGDEKPGIKSAGKVTASEFKNLNLVLIGVADSNSVLNDVYQMFHSSGITAAYPGPNKGILEIMTNIWNPDKTFLIAAGSDELGLKSVITTLDRGGLKNKSMEITDWTEVTGVTFPIDSEEEAIKYAQLDPDVIAYTKGLTDSGLTTGAWASFDQVEKIWSVGIFAKNASDIWYEIHFRTDGTIISKNEGVI